MPTASCAFLILSTPVNYAKSNTAHTVLLSDHLQRISKYIINVVWKSLFSESVFGVKSLSSDHTHLSLPLHTTMYNYVLLFTSWISASASFTNIVWKKSSKLLFATFHMSAFASSLRRKSQSSFWPVLLFDILWPMSNFNVSTTWLKLSCFTTAFSLSKTSKFRRPVIFFSSKKCVIFSCSSHIWCLKKTTN